MPITTNIQYDDIHSRTMHELVDLLPKFNNVDNINIIDINGTFCVERKIPLYPKFENEYILFEWENMYHIATKHISQIMLKSKECFVIKMTPSVHDSYDATKYEHEVIFRIITEMHIAGRMDEIVSIWTYEYIGIDKIFTEWRCGSCATPNNPKERWCTQCGSPRTMLAQEMMCIHCGTPRNDKNDSCDQCGALYIDFE